MNYYEILGVNKNSSQKEIRESYKNLVKKYHPDLYRGDKSFAEKKTKEINVAYDVLSNPEKRAEYDEEISPKPTYTENSYNQNVNYNQNINYNKSNLNYDDYKQKYSKNYYYNNRNTRDGSEHDYSTYVNYENINKSYNYRYSQYGRSNYSNRKDYRNEIYDKIMNKFDKASSNTKRKIVISLFFIYLLFIIFFLKDINTFFNPKNEIINHSSSYQNEETNIINTNKNTNKNTLKKENTTNSRNDRINTSTQNNNTVTVKIPSSTETDNGNNNDNNDNTSSNNSTNNNSYNIYDIYSEDELQAIYKKYYEGSDIFDSYDEFKETFEYYLNEYVFNY